MNLRLLIAAVAALVVTTHAVQAAPSDAVLNKEGYWGIDVDGRSCAASLAVEGGAIFLFRGYEGQLTPALFSPAPLPKGKTFRLQTDSGAIDLPAAFADKRTAVYLNDALADDAVATLGASRNLRLFIDEREIAAMTLAGTGFAQVLKDVADCSNGKRGWWGDGVAAEADPPGFVMNKEGLWGIQVSEMREACVAQAKVSEDLVLQLLASKGRIGLAVGSQGKRLPRGRAGRVETDSYAFAFTPQYDEKALYMNSADLLDEVALGILRKAHSLVVVVDRKTLVDVALDDSGFAEVLDAVAACSRGEKGWWTPAAKAS